MRFRLSDGQRRKGAGVKTDGWKTGDTSGGDPGPADGLLVRRARGGDRDALTALVERYQNRIYNLTLRMTGNPADAEDRTQEILIKLITGLASFKGKSAFSTWLFRIVINHNINARRTAWEKYFRSFDSHEQLKTRMENASASAVSPSRAEQNLFLEETKNGCLACMLLCLDRMQRMVLITGSIFNLDSATAARVLDMTPANFRQILSRSRRRLAAFMDVSCGIMNPRNDCRCGGKVDAAVRMGIAGRRWQNLRGASLGKIREFVSGRKRLIDDALALRMEDVLRDLPFYRSPACDGLIRKILARPEVKSVIDFDPAEEV
jgi:RNA polymerase sigma factor (sigma-70 family)